MGYDWGAMVKGKFVLVALFLSLLVPAALTQALDLEAQKVRIEEDKLKIERAKLDEQSRATVITAIALALSAIAGFGTILYNANASNQQAKLQASLKALEVVMSAGGPTSARQRLEVVEKILGKDLAPNVAKDMVIEGIGAGHDENRKELIRMLVEFPDQRLETLALWDIAFGHTKLKENLGKMKKRYKEA